MGESTVIQTSMHPSQQNINYKSESCRLMYAKIINGIPIDWCLYVCLFTYLPYREVGTTWLDWCPLFFPFLIPTLITAAGWQAISILKFCNFCSRTNQSQANGEITVLQTRMHPSQQKFFEFLDTRQLCSLFHIFTHTPVGIPTVYVQLEFQLCPYCNVTLECPTDLWILAGGVFKDIGYDIIELWYQ